MDLGDWPHLERHSQFKDGVWAFTLNHSQSSYLALLVLGDASHFDHPDAQGRLVALVARIPAIVSNAENFAMESPYRDVIEECDGISCDSVVVETWDDLCVWFKLKTSGHRLLGVRVLSGIPKDVYCDHP